MDHPCHKCGHSTEDGKAFCSECGAPQIRVAISDVSPDAATVGDRAVPGLPHVMEPDPLGIPTAFLPLSRSHSLRPCALAAVIGAVPMFFGLNPFLAALGTGFLAVAFSRR